MRNALGVIPAQPIPGVSASPATVGGSAIPRYVPSEVTASPQLSNGGVTSQKRESRLNPHGNCFMEIIMQSFIIKSIQLSLALLACASSAFATASSGESKRGFYAADLAGGGKAIFFVQANHSLSAYLLDKAGQQASYAGGEIEKNGTFSLTTSANQPLTGYVEHHKVKATFLGQELRAMPVPVFGKSDRFAGRFTAAAVSDAGTALEVKFLVDSQKNIYLLTKQGATVLGGFGTLTIKEEASPSPSPSPSPSAAFASITGSTSDDDETPSASPSPSPSPSPKDSGDGDDDEDADDDDGEDNSGPGKGFGDDDEAEDHREDPNNRHATATFTVNFVSGELVTGHITFSKGMLLGDLTLNGVTYTFRAPKASSDNHLANISTRAFVSNGQGQLIGGFIITGGPKLVIIRALGPSLAERGVSPVLADPTLQLFNGETLVRENDNWQSASNANDMIASGIAPTNASESAILIRLEPGFYTTVVRGVNDTTGIALVEVYEADRD